MQQKRKIQKGENKNLPEQTIPFSAATVNRATARQPRGHARHTPTTAAEEIRLITVKHKQIDVTLAGSGFAAKADPRFRTGTSVLLNPYTA